MEALPATLYITFLAFPAVATKCFRAWQCLQLKDGSSWLKEDYAVDCNGSAEYNRIFGLAWLGIAVWPLGVLALYSALLFSQRRVLWVGRSTALTRESIRARREDLEPGIILDPTHRTERRFSAAAVLRCRRKQKLHHGCLF